MTSFLLAATLLFAPADADIAYDTASELVKKHTPRESGTLSSRRAADFIHDRLKASGAKAELDFFKADTPAGELSGGEIRIAEIWLCLCSPSPFCIMDEPFSYLAPVYVETVQKLISREKANKGIIISDHNYEALLEVSDEVLLLSDGYVHLIKDRSDLVRYGYCRR